MRISSWKRKTKREDGRKEERGKGGEKIIFCVMENLRLFNCKKREGRVQGDGGGEELCDEESGHCFFFANISYFAFKEPLSKDHCYTIDRCKNPPLPLSAIYL